MLIDGEGASISLCRLVLGKSSSSPGVTSPLNYKGDVTRRSIMREKLIDVRKFLEQVRDLKKRFRIAKVARSNDKHRRRIAVLVRDEYLRLGGDIHQAFFLEADLYRLLKKVNLGSNPTPEEMRLRELPRRRGQKAKTIDPLRLVSENYDPGDEKCCPLVKIVLNLLAEEEKDGLSGDNLRGGTPQTFEHFQKDARLFTKQTGPSLYRAD